MFKSATVKEPLAFIKVLQYYSKTCVRQPPLKLTFVVDVERWLSYKGTCHVILLAKLHDMCLYNTDNFFHINHYLKSVSKVALLHRFYCTLKLPCTEFKNLERIILFSRCLNIFKILPQSPYFGKKKWLLKKSERNSLTSDPKYYKTLSFLAILGLKFEHLFSHSSR